MIEVSNSMIVSYMIIGFILGLVTTTFVIGDSDMDDRTMILIIIMLLWLPAIVVGGSIAFFAGAVKGADWLKVKLTPYFQKQA